MAGENIPRAWHALAVAIAIAGLIATYFGAFGFFLRIFALGSHELLAMVAYLILLVTCIIIVTLLREYQTARKEKYANVTSKIHGVIHKSRNLMTFIESQSSVENCDQIDEGIIVNRVKRELEPLLDDVAQTFAMITGTKCRAAIKVVGTHGSDDIYLETLARDSHSTQACGERDARRSRTKSDLLVNNPETMKVLSNDNHDWHFLENNLPSLDGFRSSSFNAYDGNFGQVNRVGTIWKRLRGLHWPLPYKSTLFCAIRHPEIAGMRDEDQVVGFLCIDSESRNVFSKRWDVELCFAFADSLFHPIERLLQIGSR